MSYHRIEVLHNGVWTDDCNILTPDVLGVDTNEFEDDLDALDVIDDLVEDHDFSHNDLRVVEID
jgi:hypothetical protein